MAGSLVRIVQRHGQVLNTDASDLSQHTGERVHELVGLRGFLLKNLQTDGLELLICEKRDGPSVWRMPMLGAMRRGGKRASKTRHAQAQSRGSMRPPFAQAATKECSSVRESVTSGLAA